MNGNNPLLASAHRDVLQATIPDKEESRISLVAELQNRGRAAVGAKSWMDAKLLYEKAIEVSTSCITPEEKIKAALFQANLSLVEKNMGNVEAARVVAEQATQTDKSYIKGWWRLGQALSVLHRHKEALEAFEKAKELEPSNKALLKECEKVKKTVEEEEELMKLQKSEEDQVMEDSTSKEDAKSTTSTTTTKSTTTTSSSKSSTTSTSSSTPTAMDVDVDDAKLFSKSDAVRGYKVVNGKKTSYFHNELSEEAKNLIGDIAPKKLDTVPPPASATPSKDGASAWNQAGTWEEKDVTKWATESLKDKVMITTFALPASSPAPNALVSVTKVSKCDGHASFAMARGKKRYIYEYCLTLEWTLQLDSQGLECSGKLTLPDIDGTVELGEGYEMVDFVVDSASDDSVRPLLDRFVHRGGFRDALNESVDDWVRLFKETY